MSAVDVLAVLDEVIADMGGDTPGTTGHRLAEARDAVAELIEAAAGVESLARLNAAPLRAYVAAVDRLTAALSSAGGAK